MFCAAGRVSDLDNEADDTANNALRDGDRFRIVDHTRNVCIVDASVGGKHTLMLSVKGEVNAVIISYSMYN